MAWASWKQVLRQGKQADGYKWRVLICKCAIITRFCRTSFILSLLEGDISRLTLLGRWMACAETETKALGVPCHPLFA